MAMQRIVVGLDDSAAADRALAWAVREAELHLADVDVVHCYVAHARGAVMHMPDRERADARLDEMLTRNRQVLDRTRWSADTIGVLTQPSTGLVDAAEGADLVVVGSRGSGGFTRLRLGSTGYRTAAHSSTPVVVVPDAATTDLDGRRPLVVGVDGSRAAGRALRWAVDEARHRDVPLTAVHASRGAEDRHDDGATSDGSTSGTAGERLLEVALDEVDTAGVTVERVVTAGGPADTLLAQSAPDGLLVLGTHGRGTVGRMVFGSVSHQCLHHADGPVVIVP